MVIPNFSQLNLLLYDPTQDNPTCSFSQPTSTIVQVFKQVRVGEVFHDDSAIQALIYLHEVCGFVLLQGHAHFDFHLDRGYGDGRDVV